MPSNNAKRSGQIRKGLTDALLIALEQLGRRAGLNELALASGAASSSTLHALRRLVAAGLVTVHERAYGLDVPEPLRRGALFLAVRRMRRDDALAVAARANEAVEFAALAPERLFVVYTPSASAEAAVRFERLAKDAYPQIRPQSFDAERLRRGTVEGIEATARIRARVARARVLKGSLTATFLDRSKRGEPDRARRLHRPHPSLRPLTRRHRQELARMYGLAEISLFGSAVRSDFRPDSDVDVLVRSRKGRSMTLAALAGLKADLERHFQRRVDVLDDAGVIEDLRPLIERDKVRLYGRSLKKRVPSQAGEAVRGAGDRGSGERRRELAR